MFSTIGCFSNLLKMGGGSTFMGVPHFSSSIYRWIFKKTVQLGVSQHPTLARWSLGWLPQFFPKKCSRSPMVSTWNRSTTGTACSCWIQDYLCFIWMSTLGIVCQTFQHFTAQPEPLEGWCDQLWPLGCRSHASMRHSSHQHLVGPRSWLQHIWKIWIIGDHHAKYGWKCQKKNGTKTSQMWSVIIMIRMERWLTKKFALFDIVFVCWYQLWIFLDMFCPAESHKCRQWVLICRILVTISNFVALPTVPLMPNLQLSVFRRLWKWYSYDLLNWKVLWEFIWSG